MFKSAESQNLSTQEMFDEIITVISSFSNEEIKKILLYVFYENKNELLIAANNNFTHHREPGGLLCHTYNVMRLSQFIYDFYSPTIMNKDLFIGGSIIHDVGKLWEHEYDESGNCVGTSKKGALLRNHLYLGAAYVSHVCKQLGISEEISILFQHIILAHHNSLEGGLSEQRIFEVSMIELSDTVDGRYDDLLRQYENISPNSFKKKDGKILYSHQL